MDGGRNQDIRGFFAYFLSLKESRGQAFCERKRKKRKHKMLPFLLFTLDKIHIFIPIV